MTDEQKIADLEQRLRNAETMASVDSLTIARLTRQIDTLKATIKIILEAQQ